jgi:hypothetical protein
MSRREIEHTQVRQYKAERKRGRLNDFNRAKNALKAEVKRIQSNGVTHDYTRFSLLKFRPELLWEIKQQTHWGAELPSDWFPFAITYDGRIYRKYWFGWVRSGLTRKSLVNACLSLNLAR